MRPQSKIQNRKSKIGPYVAVLVSLVAVEARGQTTAVVHRADGRVEKIELIAALFESPDKALLRGRVPDGLIDYSANEIWQIEFGAERVARGSTEQLWLNDGTRLSGRLAQWIPSQRATIWTDLFRTIAIWDDTIVGLTHGYPPPARLPTGIAGKDVLYTSDGDRMVGQLLRMENDNIAFRSELGNMTYDRQRVRALVLTAKSEVPNRKSEIGNLKSAGPWVLEFANGDRLWTPSWMAEGGRLRCAIGGGTPTAPVALLSRAIFLGPHVQIFSAIEPKHFTMRPLLAGQRSILVDRGPENRPLRIGQCEYLFGLFLRPQCEMEYALSDDAQFFLAEVGISSDLAREPGSARILFAVGDTPWRTFNLTKDNSPVPVVISLGGSSRFRIRVEASDDWGCGAHVVLGEPVLTKRWN